MGYEVLDARGNGSAAPSTSGRPPVEVLELDELQVDDEPDQGAATDSSRWHQARSALARVPHGGLELLLPVLAALVVGALLGGFVTGQRAAARERAERRSTLAVVAQVESSAISEVAGSVEANVTATVTNSGPEAVTLVTDAKGTEPTPAKPVVVTQRGEGSRIEPGAGSAVTLAVALQCSGESVPDVSVKVRTADGRIHAVPLRSASSVGTISALCTNVEASTPRVTAHLRGSTARPVLVLFNDRDVAVRVSIPEPRNLVEPSLSGLVEVTTTPALPMVIGAGDQRQLPITVVATRCLDDIDLLSNLNEIALRPLVVAAANGQPLDEDASRAGSSETVDLSLLVNQAVARACR